MLMQMSALQALEVLQELLLRSPEFCWLLDWQAAARTNQSCHALVDEDADHALYCPNRLPDGGMPQVGSLRVFSKEMV